MKHPVSRSRRENQKGNAILEFALCSTMLMLLMCGVTSFSRIFNIEAMAQGAAEAGVLWAALSPSNYNNLSGIQNAALLDTGNYAGATATATQFCTCSVGGTQVSCPASCESGTGQTYVQVSVTVPYSPIITWSWIPDPINVTQTACARVQ